MAQRGVGARIEELAEGEDLPEIEVFLSREQVRAYVQAAGMWAPRFVDDAAARQEGLPGMITPGNMSAGLLVRMLGELAPAARLERLGVTFRGFVLPDQRLRLRGTVTGKAQREDGTALELDLCVETEGGEHPVIGTASLVLPRAASGGPSA